MSKRANIVTAAQACAHSFHLKLNKAAMDLYQQQDYYTKFKSFTYHE